MQHELVLPGCFDVDDVDAFRAGYDSEAFEFEHHFVDHPLFERDRLIELARFLSDRPGDVFYNVGDVQVGESFDDRGPADISVVEAIERIEESGSWVVLKRIERHPDYAWIIDRAKNELGELRGIDPKTAIRESEAFLFLASPNRVTSYHIDPEVGFLFQISGEKTVYTFDREDPEVLTQEELERYYYHGDSGATQYREELQNRAEAHVIEPGTGVHLPVHTPHWVQNHDNVSLSMSIGFEFWASRFRCSAYRANYALRRLGFRPRAPGTSPLVDKMKWGAFGVARRAGQSMRKLLGK